MHSKKQKILLVLVAPIVGGDNPYPCRSGFSCCNHIPFVLNPVLHMKGLSSKKKAFWSLLSSCSDCFWRRPCQDSANRVHVSFYIIQTTNCVVFFSRIECHVFSGKPELKCHFKQCTSEGRRKNMKWDTWNWGKYISGCLHGDIAVPVVLIMKRHALKLLTIL